MILYCALMQLVNIMDQAALKLLQLLFLCDLDLDTTQASQRGNYRLSYRDEFKGNSELHLTSYSSELADSENICTLHICTLPAG